jgi:hypothetical protein
MSWTREQDAEWRVAVDVLGDDPTQNGHRPKLAASSWAPLELGPIVAGIQAGDIVGPVPHLMARSDGVSLLYPGEVHSLAGEPESGKGWAALHTAKVSIQLDDDVLYLDFEDAPASIVTRLLALGADPEAILAHFVYVRPVDPFNTETFHALTESRRYALAIIDGVSEAYALLDLDPYSNVDAARFLSVVARPLAETGAAVLLIDHVVKSKETRGRYAIGAQHKLAGIAAAYSTDVIKNPSRTDDGLIKIKVEKDRHGHVRGHAQAGVIALLRVAPIDGGAAVTVTLDPPTVSFTQEGDWRPTNIMEKVSKVVEAEPGIGVKAIRRAIDSKAPHVDQAVKVLLAERYLEQRIDGQAKRHTSLREYREVDDEPTPPNRVPTVSQPCPGHGAEDRVPVSPPLRDTDTVHTTPGHTNRVPLTPSLTKNVEDGLPHGARP